MFRVIANPEFSSGLEKLRQRANRGDEIEVISIVLEVLDRKEYNRKFGYKKSWPKGGRKINASLALSE